MKDKKDKSDLTEGHEQELFSNLEFSYSRSKADVWASMEGVLGEESEEQDVETAGESESVENEGKDDAQIIEFPAEEVKPTRSIRLSRTFMSIAASLALILCAGLMARFYTTTVHVAPGEFTSHTLPDGSEVHLNAATTIKYHPYWWKIDRAVKLNGEAYFVVAKGKKFTVDAVLGSTEVLGTEFNVYARGDNFTVLCEEGKVKVSSQMIVEGTQRQVTLTKGEMAVLELNRLTKQGSNISTQTSQGVVTRTAILGWRTGQFIYNTTPVAKVFEDLKRQYDISLSTENGTIDNAYFSGAFNRNMKVEEALEIVCVANGLIFEKVDVRSYLIRKQ
ncbi:MAG: DUF4974 domain-containing protein [Roseivirga sp.]|nr:DUF4974 domain-containing protein [Roseivirga sp.]